MKYKIMVLYIALTPLCVLSVENLGQSVFEKKLDDIETAIIRADYYTSYCQQSTNWHFPDELYAYLERARTCYQKGGKKHLKKANQYVLLLDLIIDSTIEGQPGYWRSNAQEVWIDAVPPIPACALDEFMELKEKVKPLISFSPEEILFARQESSR